MDALDSAGKARTVISCYDYSAYPKATAVNSELQVDHVFAHSSYVPVFHNHQNPGQFFEVLQKLDYRIHQ